MKTALFIDRDGTILVEPPVDYQVDSYEKFAFVPDAISGLKALAALDDYELVLATNQDGLGTPAFPMESFQGPHDLMLRTLRGEGVEFDDQLIDPTMPDENAPTRKPGTGMFGKYLSGQYDLANSYVIGDRITDMQLAKNLGARGIMLCNPEVGEMTPDDGQKAVKDAGLDDTVDLVTDSWLEAADFVRIGKRRATVKRTTRETDIEVSIDLDGRADGDWKISTGLHFLDHMLSQISHHGGVALSIKAKGDLEVDEHHTMEDVAIVLGEAIDKALGSKVGIGRYGFALPMDDCAAIVLLDFGGRIDFEWDAEFKREYVGDVPTEMLRHFFMSLCAASKCNLQISAKGENEHHKAEAIFKAYARALRMALARKKFEYELPSSKGLL
ncbi:MAG: bifunctional histidinol-phosphatase/imidazoleglycerol-phosphate dehydratase HisB [Bacteroidales bacterium]|nr:bifunctional histidinol-phosphatase/imidazoleglycerol-phosphate dehydratase HisB [Bacteroidales bacterium]